MGSTRWFRHGPRPTASVRRASTGPARGAVEGPAPNRPPAAQPHGLGFDGRSLTGRHAQRARERAVARKPTGGWAVGARADGSPNVFREWKRYGAGAAELVRSEIRQRRKWRIPRFFPPAGPGGAPGAREEPPTCTRASVPPTSGPPVRRRRFSCSRTPGASRKGAKVKVGRGAPPRPEGRPHNPPAGPPSGPRPSPADRAGGRGGVGSPAGPSKSSEQARRPTAREFPRARRSRSPPALWRPARSGRKAGDARTKVCVRVGNRPAAGETGGHPRRRCLHPRAWTARRGRTGSEFHPGARNTRLIGPPWDCRASRPASPNHHAQRGGSRQQRR